MPSSMLFALDNEGRVFGISTNNTKWREFPYLGLEFKHLSAVPYFLWAVGGDRQIYVHVHGLDIPIRIKEEAYENQRWLPMDGFSKRLLPTDRHNFSSKDGLTERRLETIRLPSMAWQWEGDWCVETTLDGQPLDHDGWTYAVDFPATYHSEKQWSSCVRRRKWVRYRRYTAMNSWCAIAPLHKDPTQEPFIDVCIGGQSVAGAVAGSLQVWAVTAHGRDTCWPKFFLVELVDGWQVMWRGGVSHMAPEGTRWSSIPVPTGCEVRHISCGPTGLVWAALWNGRALVRVGVSGSSLTGDYWLEVVAPEPDLKLSQVSVGGDSVWALTSDGRVWFRKGVRGCATEDNEGSARGSGWVEMVGRMVSMSVAPNDQVWAVGSEDRGLYCRCGVSNAELTGRCWRAMRAPSQSSRASSSCSSLRSSCGVQPNDQNERHHSTASLNNKSSSSERGDSEWSQEASRSAPTSLPLQSSASQWQRATDGSSLAHSTASSTRSMHQTIAENSMLSQSEVDLSKRSVAAWSPVHSVGSLLGLEVNTEMDPDTVLDPESERDVFRERERPGEPAWQQAASLWTCVEAGALLIDPLQLPNWFVETSVLSQFESASWRTQILLELKRRRTMEISVFEKYELAVELSSWVKSGECRCCLSGTLQPYEDCLLELECVRNQAGSMDSGTLSVLSVDKGYTQCQLSLGALTLVQNYSEPGSPRIAVHTVSTTQSSISPLRLLFSSDTDMHDWMAHLTSVCCQMNGLEGAPGPGSIWATTALGEVYTYDPVSIELHQQREGELFTQALDVRGKLTPTQLLLANGFPTGSRLFIYGMVPDNAERFVVNLQCQSRADCKEIALHLNPRFPDNCFVRNTMTGGNWGKEEREGALTLAPGKGFTLDIICREDGYKISVNGMVFTYYEHRLKPDGMIYLWISGSVDIEKAVYFSKRAILSQNEMFWRQMGGHLSKVETCRAGVTWGLGADSTPWVYTGGWGGTFLNGSERSSAGIFPLSDTHCCYVYENQRWNPLNGFTTRKLPTDRPMWSDATGRVKRTKETTRLLSMHWQWVTDWVVDYNTPGGVDKDGWQYAVDFSTSYHRRKHLTDYVRRRRWLRKCRYTATGPWQEAGNTKLCDVSLAGATGQDTVWVWAVGANGDALFRRGVSKTSPVGDIWEHIPCDQALCSISCGSSNQVWAVGSNGSTYWRFGITANNPMGEVWECVEPPGGAVVTQVCVGGSAVWVLDRDGRLHVRREVTPVFPEGTHWQLIGDPAEGGVQQLSVGGDEVWAVTGAGAVCCRSGITADNPDGDSWHYGLAGNWQHISARGFNDAGKK